MTPEPGTGGAAPSLDSLAVAKLMLRAGREVEIGATGRSMSPSIPRGATLRLRPPTGSLTPGDVISFQSGGVLLTHRIVAISGGQGTQQRLVARGDAATICDTPITRDDVLGVVVSFSDGPAWRDVPSPISRHGWRGVVAAVIVLAVRATLPVHARLAGGVIMLARWCSAARSMALRHN